MHTKSSDSSSYRRAARLLRVESVCVFRFPLLKGGGLRHKQLTSPNRAEVPYVRVVRASTLLLDLSCATLRVAALFPSALCNCDAGYNNFFKNQQRMPHRLSLRASFPVAKSWPKNSDTRVAQFGMRRWHSKGL